MASKQVDYTGQTLDGRYTVIKRLAAGGMGSVYLARHTVVGRNVAIKFLHEDFADNEVMIKRFYREAQAAAAIAHKNIIDVWDVGVSPAGDPYLAMEYLEGESLTHLLKRTGPISLPAACEILAPVLSALLAAHAKGVVHRDLKPDNIFLARIAGESGPVVKLIDFGISKFSHDRGASKITQTGVMLGTPDYMPPEQIRGDREVDHRADLYAVGVIFYQMLTGGLPFEGDNYNALIINVLTEYPKPPETVYPEFPTSAEPLIMQLLEKDPSDRAQTAEAVAANLKTLATRKQRVKDYSLYTTGLTKTHCAAGALGEDRETGSKGAKAVLSELSSQNTLGAWAASGFPGGRRSVRWRFVIGGLVGLVASIVIAAVWVLGVGEKEHRLTPASTRSSTPIVTHSATPRKSSDSTGRETGLEGMLEDVAIDVSGIPSDGVVYLDGKRQSRIPIVVPKMSKVIQLKVEAPGRIPYIANVVPLRDLSITATLKPAPSRHETSKGDEAHTTEKKHAPEKKKKVTAGDKKKESPKEGTGKKAEEKKLIQGGRGIKFTRGFDD